VLSLTQCTGLPIFCEFAEIRGFHEPLGHFWDRCKLEKKIFEGGGGGRGYGPNFGWWGFRTGTINSFVIFNTVPKSRHASAYIVMLAAYGTSVSDFLIGQIESFPAFYFRITNHITVYIVALVCCQNVSKCRILKKIKNEQLKKWWQLSIETKTRSVNLFFTPAIGWLKLDYGKCWMEH